MTCDGGFGLTSERILDVSEEEGGWMKVEAACVGVSLGLVLGSSVVVETQNLVLGIL